MIKYKYLVPVFLSGISLLIRTPDNVDLNWKLIPGAILLLWYLITMAVFFTESFSKLINKYKFGSFREGGAFLHKDYMIYAALISFTTFYIYYLIVNNLLT